MARPAAVGQCDRRRAKSMSEHAESHTGLFMKVWFGLLALTVIEVFLAYIQLGKVAMITLLMGLSLVKAAMIMAYFMHLKFDKPGLSWILCVPLVGCLLIMVGYFFPDSYRILELGN
jgi:cytochrome c oxidase subunit 4